MSSQNQVLEWRDRSWLSLYALVSASGRAEGEAKDSFRDDGFTSSLVLFASQPTINDVVCLLDDYLQGNPSRCSLPFYLVRHSTLKSCATSRSSSLSADLFSFSLLSFRFSSVLFSTQLKVLSTWLKKGPPFSLSSYNPLGNRQPFGRRKYSILNDEKSTPTHLHDLWATWKFGKVVFWLESLPLFCLFS